MTFNRRKNAKAAKIRFAPKEKIPMKHVSEAYWVVLRSEGVRDSTFL